MGLKRTNVPLSVTNAHILELNSLRLAHDETWQTFLKWTQKLLVRGTHFQMKHQLHLHWGMLSLNWAICENWWKISCKKTADEKKLHSFQQTEFTLPKDRSQRCFCKSTEVTSGKLAYTGDDKSKVQQLPEELTVKRLEYDDLRKKHSHTECTVMLPVFYCTFAGT